MTKRRTAQDSGWITASDGEKLYGVSQKLLREYAREGYIRARIVPRPIRDRFHFRADFLAEDLREIGSGKLWSGIDRESAADRR
jgi:hypothetical protein